MSGVSVLKSVRNGKLNFFFLDDEIIYELENINPLFEAQSLEIVKTVLE
jgi:hypothetical protein